MDPINVAERLGRWSAGRGALYALLAARLRCLIDDGELPPGTPLPPDRVLASTLAVGRSTVVAAYDLLQSEGRIVRRQGSGTRVAGHPPTRPVDTTSAPVFLDLLEPRPDVIALACAAPDTPPVELTECYARILPELAATIGDIGYYPTGHPRLRHAIAEYYRSRGVPTAFEQVMVTTGGQQALSLLARGLLQPGDHVLMESPSSPPALEAFRAEAAVVQGLPPGLPGFAAAVREHRPALAYVIPTFQNPTGSVLAPLARRRLAETAAAAGVPLVEDEVLAELGFPGFSTPPPLAAHSAAVITVGSLSKTVWGGLRIGWIRAAAPIIARLARIRAVHDLGGDVPAQLAAAELVPRLAAVCARLAPERQARHDHLRAELARLLPDWHVPAVTGGQTLWVRLPYGDGTSFAQAALRHGVAILPGSGLDPNGGSADHIRVHFLHPPDILTEAARRLTEAWRAYRPPARPAPAPPALAI
ncbi:PLP-dependent aminotransferase family protein [Nocardia iowensis]|uniref:PLP-dependent aminotransferase family protein n=1 Tax=Nocardia iowensis TaxID=204891 RepID=A0ABX8RRP1_NOCIO|nr:PLP-dependent aminotransferase family protein [Nocardia iowensis]QXN91562.1 PLP-dependent aminotransferase family protein [Nocardia iowensis]